MALDDARDDRQTDTVALDGFVAVKPFEDLEQLRRKTHVEATTVVGDRDRYEFVIELRADGHCPFGHSAGILECVREEVVEDRLDQVWIALDDRKRLELELDVVRTLGRESLREAAPREPLEIDALRGEFATSGSRELKQVEAPASS